MAGRVPPVVIATLAVPVEDAAAVVARVPGARLVRELPPGRVVVVLHDASDAGLLAAQPEVVSVVPDRLEHPTG
ncbi:MAG: hypothetical protein GC157_04575 [Frankiales bacterium]|nr:hypothetical protein [Frankiales bacterium]